MWKVSKSTARLALVLFSAVIIMIFGYIALRILYFIIADYPFTDKLIASLLLAAELFGLVEAIGFFWGSIQVTRWGSRSLVLQTTPPLREFPPVLIVIPSYKEPLDVIKNTLICIYNLTYPNKYIVLLDDTRYDKPWATEPEKEKYKREMEEIVAFMGGDIFRRQWRGAKAGIINDFIQYLEGKEFPSGSFSGFQRKEFPEMKYMIIFDVDVNPLPDFVEKLVGHMEIEPKAAFIQTPQYYTNFEINRVARVAGLQQILFYENICEGKEVGSAMFCCGTNVVMRLSALKEVGGFDETTVTEDIVTSFKLHRLGWKSLYYNRISAFGLGPEDLGGYFKQQHRWALGNMGLLRTYLRVLPREYRKLSLSIWWEYFLSSTHYLIGWFFFFMYIFPILFIFFNIPTYFVNTSVYLFVFFPYLLFSCGLMYWTMRLHNMRPLHILLSIIISSVTFPIYMKAAVHALQGQNGTFIVTPKGKADSLPLWDLAPQLGCILLSTSAFTWGLSRIYYEQESLFGLWINVVWIALNLLMMLPIFYFNSPQEIEEIACGK